MRVLATELKKLLSNKILLLIIAAVFVLNSYLMFRTANSGEAKPVDYKAVYSELEDLSDPDKLQWLDDRLGEFEGQHSFNWTALGELRDEAANIVGYSDYLASIDSQARSMTGVSIFAKPDTFNYRSIVKTPPAYDSVRDVEPIFDVSKGIDLATDNSFTDILSGFIVLFAVLSLMISDREQGMSGLLFALKRGRGYLLFLKIIALAITIFTVVLLIYAENLIVAGSIYGLGDLSRPIQSLNGFIGCNLKISVIGYLILYVLFKFIAMFAIGAVLSLIAVNTKNVVSFYGISAVILIVEGLTYAKIHPLSIYSIFRYINLISFTKVNEIFCNYKNINFWEYPIPLIPTSIGALLIISSLCAVLSTYLYAKKRNLEFRKIGFKFRFGNGNKIHSKLYYTLYKSLIMQKGLLIIAFFIAVSVFMSEAFIKKYDPVDVYYEYYTTETEGEITQETIDFYDSEAIRFEELNARLESPDITSEEEREIYKQLAPTMGFYPSYERLRQIKDIENAHMFYDTGYKRAFGINGYDDDMKYAFAAILLCLFLISPLIANDNKYRMKSIINSTSSGRKNYISRNILTACIYVITASLLWLIPYAVTISRYYGHSGLSASIRSITDFINFPLNISVLQYIILICLLRTVSVLFASLIMLWVSSMCRNIISAVLINFAVFALPIIIYLLGAEFMVNIGFDPLLSVNVMLNKFTPMQLAVPTLVLVGFAIRKKTL
ncbi:MAG: hypothetical protein J6B75_04700 [Ruminococcus sp.]|nr:hypothetical protein [Ruminococcus sp.]